MWNAFSVFLRGLYLWLVQAAVGIVWLLLVAYLAVNSPSAAGLLSQVLTEALPGTLQIQRLQVGPSPGFIRLGGVTIDAPDGTRVIRLGRGELRVQLLRLLTLPGVGMAGGAAGRAAAWCLLLWGALLLRCR